MLFVEKKLTPLTIVRLHDINNVVIATQLLLPGLRAEAGSLAVCDMKASSAVHRYNQTIGFAKADMATGQPMRSHNFGMGEFKRDDEAAHDLPAMAHPVTFVGGKHPNGKHGPNTLNGIYLCAKPIEAKGFVHMGTPGDGSVSATGQATSGAQIICLITGQTSFGVAGHFFNTLF